ncbi:MAG: hypothetical protein IKE69_11600 [Thermoguttaceae bacterium]|nr:hypothetical protein [Thermoguttaceae bacterium]
MKTELIKRCWKSLQDFHCPYNFPISLGNTWIDDSFVFILEADFIKIIDRINEFYRSPDSEDDPGFLPGLFLGDVENWFAEHMPDYKYKSTQYADGYTEFTGEAIPKDKLDELAEYLLAWIDSCYNYEW